jgi:hypothetical protein
MTHAQVKTDPVSGQVRVSYRQQAAGLVLRLVKASVLRLIEFIVARPRLDGFLRHQIYRFPGLAGRARVAIARSRRKHGQVLPSVVTDEADLTDNARQVLHDLRRAIEHNRPT